MSISQRLTEDQIERIAERDMNTLDRLLLARKMTQAEYDKEAKQIARWSETAWKRRVFAE